MHFERGNAFQIHKKKILEKKKLIKICVPTLPKISRSFTRNTLIVLFGLNRFDICYLTIMNGCFM